MTPILQRAPVTLLTLHQVERAHGDLIVFEGASLRIDERDRIGIVGDNGSGKTTLLRVLCGLDEPDHGERSTRRGLEVSWTSQIPDLEPGTTILESARASFARLDELEAELRELEAAMAERPEDPAPQRRYEQVHTAFEAAGGYDRERFVERALLGLGFVREEWNKTVDVLSGGEKVRVALARALLVPAELLVLDEPTNHLDLEGIAFLEQTLAERRGAFVVVSHDRRFLDTVCTSIVEVDSARVTRYPGNYSAFREQQDRELKTAMREYAKQQDFVQKEMAYIRKHMGSRWTAQAKGRLKRLSRLQLLAKPKTSRARMRLDLGSAKGLSGQCVIEADGLAKTFDGQSDPLWHDLDLRVFHGDRVALLGRNGSGKTTLLATLAGRQQASSGKIERAKLLRIGFFSQQMEDLPTTGTVLSTFMALVPQWTEGECRDHLALFVFRGDDVDKDVTTLSGGEKRRLCLARLIVQPFDICFFDEPTNHLDIATREALEEALADYKGTIVVVSHDRWFVSRVVRQVYELRSDRIVVHNDGIEGYERSLVERRRAEEALRKQERHERRRLDEAARGPSSTTEDNEDDLASRSGQVSAKIRNPFAFEKLEREIIELEEALERIDATLHDPDAWKDPDGLKAAQARQTELGDRLKALYEKWENWQ